MRVHECAVGFKKTRTCFCVFLDAIHERSEGLGYDVRLLRAIDPAVLVLKSAPCRKAPETGEKVQVALERAHHGVVKHHQTPQVLPKSGFVAGLLIARKV